MSLRLMEMVKKVQFEQRISREEVASKLGYTREHLYTLIKKDDPDTIAKMYMAFPKELIQDVEKDLAKDEKIAAHEAAIKIMWLEIIHLKSLVTKESTTKITLDMEAMLKHTLEQ